MAVASPGWISGDASSCFLAALDLAALVLATLGILVKNVFSDGLMLHATSDTALGRLPSDSIGHDYLRTTEPWRRVVTINQQGKSRGQCEDTFANDIAPVKKLAGRLCVTLRVGELRDRPAETMERTASPRGCPRPRRQRMLTSGVALNTFLNGGPLRMTTSARHLSRQDCCVHSFLHARTFGNQFRLTG
jgi:hypothetical protein